MCYYLIIECAWHSSNFFKYKNCILLYFEKGKGFVIWYERLASSGYCGIFKKKHLNVVGSCSLAGISQYHSNSGLSPRRHFLLMQCILMWGVKTLNTHWLKTSVKSIQDPGKRVGKRVEKTQEKQQLGGEKTLQQGHPTVQWKPVIPFFDFVENLCTLLRLPFVSFAKFLHHLGNY